MACDLDALSSEQGKQRLYDICEHMHLWQQGIGQRGGQKTEVLHPCEAQKVLMIVVNGDM